MVETLVKLFTNILDSFEKVIAYIDEDEATLCNLAHAIEYYVLWEQLLEDQPFNRVGPYYNTIVAIAEYIENIRIDIVLHKYTTDKNFIELKRYLSANNSSIIRVDNSKEFNHNKITIKAQIVTIWIMCSIAP